MNRSIGNSNRSGQVNTNVLIAGGIAAAVVVGLIIAFAVHSHNKKVARENSKAHLAACIELQGQITAEKTPLNGAGLAFQPYAARYDAAAQLQKKAESLLESDPQQAEKIVGEAETGYKAVLADLHLAVQVKTDKSGTSALQSAEKHAADTRAQMVSFNYPGSPSSRSEHYRLDEEGQNPDAHVAACRRLLGTIDASLNTGAPQEAARILEEAKQEAAAADRCIDDSLACKTKVETQVAGLKDQSESTDQGYLGVVEAFYFKQQFVASASRLDALKQRIDDRKETRELLSYCQRLLQDVSTTVSENSAYTSYATDNKFQSMKDQLTGLAEGVKQADAANWTELKGIGQRIQNGLNEVKDEASQAHRNYDEAFFAVKTLGRDYDAADRNGTPPLSNFSRILHPDITQPVREKAQEVDALKTRLDRQIKVQKSDWRQIKADAEAGSAIINDLRAKVDEDSRKLGRLQQYGERIKGVTNDSRYTCTINGKTFSAAASNRRDGGAFLSHWNAANDRYTAALNAWRNRESVGFEDALEQCKRESSAINNAGWFNLLHAMRTSSDPVAQQAAWDNGYRDNVSVDQWVDGYVNKRATAANGLFEPDLKSASGGSANFGPAPDFNAGWSN